MDAPSDPTYREVARRVRKLPPEGLLREIARLAADESRRRLQERARVEAPETPFTFAELARTVLAEARTGTLTEGSAKQGKKRGRRQRHADVGPEQARSLCDQMLRVWTPELLAAGEKDVSVLLTSVMFDQLTTQWSPTENLGRAHSLFVDGAANHPDLPGPEDWTSALGIDLDTFMRTGFALHVAMLNNQGGVSRDVLKASNVRPIWDPLTPAQLFEVIDRHFAADLDEHRSIARENQVAGFEKGSFNPLAARPLINFGTDLVAPAPHLLLSKISSTGLWYVGSETWGEKFRNALGHAFQDYVGQQLKLLQHATVMEEVTYSNSGGRKDSCDWIVVTDELVLLVEVKCARPLFVYRHGDPAALEDLRRKAGTAVRQLETTAKLIKDRHPSFLDVPADRPVRGLMVTLEPYYLGETMRDDMLESDVLPISSAWAHELENACAQLAEDPEVGARLLEGLTPGENPLVVTGSLRGVAYRGEMKRNPIVDASWDAWANWPAVAALDPGR